MDSSLQNEKLQQIKNREGCLLSMDSPSGVQELLVNTAHLSKSTTPKCECVSDWCVYVL